MNHGKRMSSGVGGALARQGPLPNTYGGASAAHPDGLGEKPCRRLKSERWQLQFRPYLRKDLPL